VNILVAEDDRVQSRLLEVHLRTKGHTVHVAFDAEAAWQAVEQAPPHVILLDLMMPGGTGLGFLKKLKSPRGHPKIPVIVLTAMEDPMVRRMAEQHGVAKLLSKPVDLSQLAAILEKLRSPENSHAELPGS